MNRGEKFFEELYQGFSKTIGSLAPAVKHELIAHRTSAALKFAVGFTHAFGSKVQIMLKQHFALAAFINGESGSKHEQTTEKKIQYCHAFEMRMTPSNIKMEHALC